MRNSAHIIIALLLCLFAVGCGHNGADDVQKAKDRVIIKKCLNQKKYTSELIDAAVDFQDKDTLCLALIIVIANNDPIKADTIVYQALNHFYNLSAKDSRNGEKTSMKRVKALVAKTYIERNDTARALIYLTSSLRDTVPSRNSAVKELEQQGKSTTELLLEKKDYKNAIDTYIESINNCNSVIIALAEAKDYKEHLKDDLTSWLLIFAIILILVIAVFSIDKMRIKHQDDEEEYQSVISSLQESTDSYSQMLSQLESQQTDNRREVDMLHRQIDKIQEEMMQRMQKGKIIYEALLRGEQMPYEFKDADSYLIDYVMMFAPDKYKHWQQTYDKLTPRSFTYLILADMGHSDKTIQDILSISASSVRSIKSRLNARKKEG